ncbi:MAG: xanthine phosphoribosyltransferase [Parasporobacterium sp.]|nr:xanthine phosphoribosyltransferase [Parasporobacterium sp.]
MRLLEEKILKDGKVFPGGVLKVGSFLNHQIDVPFMKEIGKEFYRRFKDEQITKILTIETSGIAIAVACAAEFDVPVLFAKKHQTRNLTNDCYVAHIHSYTHGNDYEARVEKQFLNASDRVLVIDDFLANGAALDGLIEIIRQAGAYLAGCGIVIEKAFQEGGPRLRKQGIRIESLAMIESMSDDGTITFVKQEDEA